MKKKIYISLPITGYDLEERKIYADNVERRLAGIGWEVVNPLKNGVAPDAHVSEHYKKDIHDMLECDAVFFCNGWRDSYGCRLEFEVAFASLMVGLDEEIVEDCELREFLKDDQKKDS